MKLSINANLHPFPVALYCFVVGRAESVSGMRVGFGGPLSPSFLEKSLKNVTKCPARYICHLKNFKGRINPNKLDV